MFSWPQRCSYKRELFDPKTAETAVCPELRSQTGWWRGKSEWSTMERPIVSALEWRVEEACLNAWPALREVLLDGWLLRFSEGLTRRANSANALAPVGSPALTKCQCLYRRLGLPTIFRVLSFADPAIDQQLAKAGYTSEGESCVLYGKSTS